MTGKVRLQKYLAQAGVASRRACEDIIRAGRVRVDGEVAQLGSSVVPGRNRVELDGGSVRPQKPRWVMLHKAPGVLCSRGDPRGRPTIYDGLSSELRTLFHVGRLDYMSEGLLLLSNDGDLAARLLHPSADLPRVYRVTVAAATPLNMRATFLRGVALEDGWAVAAAVRRLSGGRPDQEVWEIEFREGRNRVVRRMMTALGVTVHALQRISFGPLQLRSLPRGAHRVLSKSEVKSLHSAASRARSRTFKRQPARRTKR